MAVKRPMVKRYTPAYSAPAQKTARQIGKEIREHTGMSPRQYKVYYNSIRNRVINRQRDIGGAAIDVSQFLYDIDRRERRAERLGIPVEYTAEQRAILGYTSVSTAAPVSSRRAIRAIDLLIGEAGVFKSLLEKSIYVSEKFNDWVIKYIDTNDKQPNAPEINKELSRLADEIHALRKSAAGSSQNFYNKYGRRSRS